MAPTAESFTMLQSLVQMNRQQNFQLIKNYLFPDTTVVADYVWSRMLTVVWDFWLHGICNDRRICSMAVKYIVQSRQGINKSTLFIQMLDRFVLYHAIYALIYVPKETCVIFIEFYCCFIIAWSFNSRLCDTVIQYDNGLPIEGTLEKILERCWYFKTDTSH